MHFFPLAYLNPGTGSLILQVLMVGAATSVLWFRSAWHAIQSFFTRKKP